MVTDARMSDRVRTRLSRCSARVYKKLAPGHKDRRRLPVGLGVFGYIVRSVD